MGSVDDLYGVPLGDFTSARNALAARLKAAGDGDGAAGVKALRKPKLSAWAVNQTARRKRAALDALIAATEEVAGAADAAAMRSAAARRQEIISKLADAASGALADAGHAVSAATLQEIVQTFQATSDPDAAAAVAEGRLSEPLAPSGFGLAFVGDAVDAEAAEDAGSSALERKRLEESIRRLEAELDKARNLAAERRRAADRAMQRAESAEADAQDAAAEVERLQERLVEVRGGT